MIKRLLCTLILLLFLAPPSWALTTLYVNTDSTAGGDCTTNNTSGSTRACATLRAAIDLLAGTLSDAYLILVDGTAADTGDVNQTPWDMTTSATNYLTIRANTASQHNGIWSTSKYRLTCTNKNCLYNNTPSHIRFEGFQVQCTATSGSYDCVKASNANQTSTAPDSRVSGMYVLCVESGSGDYTGIQMRPSGVGGASSVAYNNIVRNCNQGIVSDFVTAAVYNNTVIGSAYGYVEGDTDGMKVVNNLASNASGIGFVGSFASGSNYNAENDGNGGPGANHRTSQTFTFVNSGSNDYHLASSDAGAKDHGTSDPGSGLYSTDVDGQTRSGTWDIGFDEYVAAASSIKSLLLLGVGQ